MLIFYVVVVVDAAVKVKVDSFLKLILAQKLVSGCSQNDISKLKVDRC